MEDGAVQLADIERLRLRAMVDTDMDLLDKLHADDFELINPAGEAYTKSEYLGAMREGKFRYLLWEPIGPIKARIIGNAGAVRYGAKVSARMGDAIIPEMHCFHTDYYEKRDGIWQVVFSQATKAQT